MIGIFGGPRLVSLAAILSGAIAFSLPVSAAEAVSEQPTPAPVVVASQAPSLTAAAPAIAAPAAAPASGPRYLPTLLEQLDLMGSPALDRSSVGLRVVTSANGMRQINLEGRFQEYVVATRGADGRIRLDCLPGLKAVRRYFEIPIAARSPRATEE